VIGAACVKKVDPYPSLKGRALKIGWLPKGKFMFQSSILKGYVSFREGIRVSPEKKKHLAIA